MRVSIIVPDNTVYVDGVPVPVDLSEISLGITAVQWYGSHGHVEFVDRPPLEISDIDEFSGIVDMAQAQIRAARTVTLEQAAGAIKAAIRAAKKRKQSEPFNGIAPTRALFDMRARCATMSGRKPIPTPPPHAGEWVGVDGVGHKMTCKELVALVADIEDRNAMIWATAKAHMDEVDRMLASGATAEEIQRYDYSEGL